VVRLVGNCLISDFGELELIDIEELSVDSEINQLRIMRKGTGRTLSTEGKGRLEYGRSSNRDDGKEFKYTFFSLAKSRFFLLIF